MRVIGIDAPERGECGYNEAKSATRRFIARGFTLKRPASVADKDRYGRQLRYVQGSSGDLGTYLLRRGLVEARYDSVDGYSRHPRQRAYRKLDRSVASSCADNADGPVSTPTRKPVPVYTPPPSPAPVYAPQPAPTPTPTYTPPTPTYTPPAPSVYYRNCDAARAAGAAPVYRGQPGYGSHLDRDGDGIGCE